MDSLPRSVYQDLVAKRVIEPAEEVPPPTVPMDYSWARVSCASLPAFGFLGIRQGIGCDSGCHIEVIPCAL